MRVMTHQLPHAVIVRGGFGGLTAGDRCGQSFKGGAMSAMYKAIQVTKPGEFATVMKPLVDPGPGQVRIRVEACGVCHSDAGTVEASLPVSWPRVPGHEVV